MFTLLLTCSLPPLSSLPPSRTSPHLNLNPPPVCSETKAEGLASSWWFHPGPVDSNPPGVFQDVRHEAPQTHLLKPQHLHPSICEHRKVKTWSFFLVTDYYENPFCFVFCFFKTVGFLITERRHVAPLLGQRACDGIAAFFYLYDCS